MNFYKNESAIRGAKSVLLNHSMNLKPNHSKKMMFVVFTLMFCGPVASTVMGVNRSTVSNYIDTIVDDIEKLGKTIKEAKSSFNKTLSLIEKEPECSQKQILIAAYKCIIKCFSIYEYKKTNIKDDTLINGWNELSKTIGGILDEKSSTNLKEAEQFFKEAQKDTSDTISKIRNKTPYINTSYTITSTTLKKDTAIQQEISKTLDEIKKLHKTTVTPFKNIPTDEDSDQSTEYTTGKKEDPLLIKEDITVTPFYYPFSFDDINERDMEGLLKAVINPQEGVVEKQNNPQLDGLVEFLEEVKPEGGPVEQEELERLAAIAEQERIEKERLAAIAEQERVAEQERLAAIAEQKRLADIAEQERIEKERLADLEKPVVEPVEENQKPVVVEPVEQLVKNPVVVKPVVKNQTQQNTGTTTTSLNTGSFSGNFNNRILTNEQF